MYGKDRTDVEQDNLDRIDADHARKYPCCFAGRGWGSVGGEGVLDPDRVFIIRCVVSG